jgi:hypothetical protein
MHRSLDILIATPGIWCIDTVFIIPGFEGSFEYTSGAMKTSRALFNVKATQKFHQGELDTAIASTDSEV